MGAIDWAVVSELVTLRHGLAVLRKKKWLEVNIASMSSGFACQVCCRMLQLRSEERVNCSTILITLNGAQRLMRKRSYCLLCCEANANGIK